ncbi:MAG: cytochrome b, partial [Acetobacteraceae bacterium]|nr:cytochrome b [Acetobacteraceae bacterium]
MAAADSRLRYDGLEISFHWVTALLVVMQYLLAQAWGFLQRGTPVRLELQSLHVSLGLLLTAVLVLRILWRAGPGRRVLPATTGLVEIASKLVHLALYALLVAVVGLGFCLRWAKHDPLSFFGLFTLALPYPFTKVQANLIGDLHNSADSLIAPRSPARTNVEAAIRDLADTARALRGFSETIQRNPNALLLGRL